MIRSEILEALKHDDVVISPLKSKLAQDVISSCPVLSEKGYKVVSVPENLFREIYRRTIKAYFLQGNISREWGAEHAIPNAYGNIPEICYLDDDFYTRVHNDQDFIKLHSEFAGVELKPSFYFGPRVYHKGDILKEHIDHPSTHIVGSSINIFCEGNPDWPLVFKVGDQYEEVVLKQGEMVIFEAVRVPHSRPIPFSGERYFGLFYHFEPQYSSNILGEKYYHFARLYEEEMKQR